MWRVWYGAHCCLYGSRAHAKQMMLHYQNHRSRRIQRPVHSKTHGSSPCCQVVLTLLPFTLLFHAHHHRSPVFAQGAKAALKEAALLALASDAFKGGQTIVFFSTKQAAHRARLQFGLAELPPVAELHGNLTQAQRLEALEAFRQVGLPVRCRGPCRACLQASELCVKLDST